MLPATEALRSSVDTRRLPVPDVGHNTSDDRFEESHARRRGVVVGGFRLLLDGGDVHEVIHYSTPRALPFTSDLCHGLLNLRGNLVTVYDLERALRATSRESSRPRWILAQQRASAWVGFPLAELPLAVRVLTEAVEQPEVQMPDLLRRNLRGAARGDDGLWLDLNWHALFKEMASQLAI